MFEKNIMRLTIPAFAAAALLAAPTARAAPTCVDKNGDTIRCGTPRAMPVGWTLSPQQLRDRQIARPEIQDTNDLLKAICLVALFLALIAAMPEFDGTRGSDWDSQEGDDDEHKRPSG